MKSDFELSDVPVMYTLYPSFHPNRARFFNTATLYSQVIYNINEALVDFVKTEFNSTQKDILQSSKLAYENYVKWENNGGQDLKLSAFKLTNRQMFWLCLTHRNVNKYHEGQSGHLDADGHLFNEYLHVIRKNEKGFRDAYKCGEVTEMEKMLYEEYKLKLVKI